MQIRGAELPNLAGFGSREGWQAAIDLATHNLGVRADARWISDNVADIFIDVADLKHVACP